MLATLLAWLYISFLCWTWGILFLQLTKRITRTEMLFPHFSIISIIGLSIITILAGILSLFIPLGDWWVQFILIIPALLIFFIKNVPYFFSSLKKEFSSLHISSLVLLSSLLLLILVMSTWKIVHPDTLGYHAQTMQWIEKYKAVPGLVHLHVRFGYQGLWFIDSALFDFSFTGKQGITYLNSTVLFWFLVFIINRVHHNFFKEGKKIYGLLWVGLLLQSLWSYTQIRLTATSASPDFIAAIFVLVIIYILIEKGTKHLHANDWLTAALLSIVAVTIKLSVAPILLIVVTAALLFLKAKKFSSFFTLFLIAAITFCAFITRNIITSGYAIFPDTTIDITDVDWKYSNELTVNEKNYITAYAKRMGVSTKDEIEAVNDMAITEWLPGWWKNRSAADKTILILFLISFIISILFLKRIINRGFISLLILFTAIAGIIFWFHNAPDPRFGFGFILSFMGIFFYPILKEKEFSIRKNAAAIILITISTGIFSYTVYRFINFFHTDQLATPLGISAAAYKTFDCEGIQINTPVNGEFGITPVPCTDQDCDKFSARGNTVQDGFKAK